jgi:UDP-glucose 4-epimerase
MSGGKIELQSSRPRRDFIFIDDVVEAYVKAIERDDSTLEAFNIASGQSGSVGEVVDLVKSIHGKPLSIAYAEEKRSGEIEDTRADISKAGKLLNWTPAVNFQEGLRRTLEASARSGV